MLVHTQYKSATEYFRNMDKTSPAWVYNTYSAVSPEVTESINELDNYRTKMNTTTTQNSVIEAIRQSYYIVMTTDSEGVMSVSPRPVIHETLISARSESRRLAKLVPGKLFVIVKLHGAEIVPTNSISI